MVKAGDLIEGNVMLSPQYTPFNGDEVAFVLGLSRFECDFAERMGMLERNIHFDERVSHATARHNLIDVVKFETVRRLGWPKVDVSALVPEIELGLDLLCALYEDCATVEVLQDQQFLLDMLNEASLECSHPFEDVVLGFSGDIRRALSAAWANSWRGLSQILRAEAINFAPKRIAGAERATSGTQILQTLY